MKTFRIHEGPPPRLLIGNSITNAIFALLVQVTQINNTDFHWKFESRDFKTWIVIAILSSSKVTAVVIKGRSRNTFQFHSHACECGRPEVQAHANNFCILGCSKVKFFGQLRRANSYCEDLSPTEEMIWPLSLSWIKRTQTLKLKVYTVAGKGSRLYVFIILFFSL